MTAQPLAQLNDYRRARDRDRLLTPLTGRCTSGATRWRTSPSRAEWRPHETTSLPVGPPRRSPRVWGHHDRRPTTESPAGSSLGRGGRLRPGDTVSTLGAFPTSPE